MSVTYIHGGDEQMKKTSAYRDPTYMAKLFIIGMIAFYVFMMGLMVTVMVLAIRWFLVNT